MKVPHMRVHVGAGNWASRFQQQHQPTCCSCCFCRTLEGPRPKASTADRGKVGSNKAHSIAVSTVMNRRCVGVHSITQTAAGQQRHTQDAENGHASIAVCCMLLRRCL